MSVRRTLAVLTLSASAAAGFTGIAFAGGSPENAPGPCVDPVSLPEYCSDPHDGTGGDPEPKPGSDITDFTNGEGDGVDTERAEQRPTPSLTIAPAPTRTGAEYVDSWSSSDSFQREPGEIEITIVGQPRTATSAQPDGSAESCTVDDTGERSADGGDGTGLVLSAGENDPASCLLPAVQAAREAARR